MGRNAMGRAVVVLVTVAFVTTGVAAADICNGGPCSGSGTRGSGQRGGGGGGGGELPEISIGNVSASEGTDEIGSTDFSFRVRRSGPTNLVSSVRFETVDGTATSGPSFDDYRARDGVVRFEEGVQLRRIVIKVRPDFDVELDETFFVRLSDPARATLGDKNGRGTIVNDDQ